MVMKKKIKMLKGECWWGGAVTDSHSFPITETSEFKSGLLDGEGNQSMPLFISSRGRVIWSEDVFELTASAGVITVSGTDVVLSSEGATLRDAYLGAMRKHFPFSGGSLPRKFFETAQYNTWMEFTYNPTQESVLAYAHSVVDNGYTPGIIIIDEGWHTRYGLWEFDFAKFPDPKGMIDELHSLGFIVMLWVVPFVTLDGLGFITTERVANKEGKKLPFLMTDDGEVAVVRWWNGYSAILNLCIPEGREYLDQKLGALVDEYGVDGFKFDGGNLTHYNNASLCNGKQTKYTPAELNISWCLYGERYTFHEYKDTFKGGGRTVIQRIRDRDHSWGGEGLATLIPFALAQGLMGYPFICPDMIGGGQWSLNLIPDFRCDEELFVRMAQCSVFFPMMQFSWAPWRMLSQESRKLCLEAAKLHTEIAPYIISQVEKCAKDGEPIVRSMEYSYPGKGYEKINDQFLLGDDYLVCPVVVKGAVTRKAILPEGKWEYVDGTVYTGDTTVTVDAPIEVLPYFKRVK